MLRTFGHQLELLGHSTEFGKRSGVHLPHRSAAVDFHSGFGDTDFVGDLFAEATPRDLNHDLALPRTKRSEALPEGGRSLFILSPSAITRKAELNRFEQLLIPKRLCQELDGAAFHRLHRHRNVAMPRDEDDRELRIRPGELALKIKAALPRQSYVEHQAGGALRGSGLEKVDNTPKQPCA